jgi:hypothetical protein
MPRKNHRSGYPKVSSLVCVTNGEEVKRIKRTEAAKLVSTLKWKYCPKSEWKKATRVAEPTEKVLEKSPNSKGNPKGKKGKKQQSE